MDLSDLLAAATAQIQATEAEALAILTRHMDAAERVLKSAIAANDGIDPGPLDLDVGGVKFARPEARAILDRGKREATRLLFDSYAATVFSHVLDPDSFIALLPAIRERVGTVLLDRGIDGNEAELCKLEWVKRAWERERSSSEAPSHTSAEPGRPTIPNSWTKLKSLLRRCFRKSTEARDDGNSRTEGLRDPVVCDDQTLRPTQQDESDAEEEPAFGDEPATPAAVADGNEQLDLSAIVDTFLERCNQEPDLDEKIIRKHIWRAVGHKHARQFQYWQSGSDKATDEDDRNFRRILSMEPRDFIALLKQKHLLSNNS